MFKNLNNTFDNKPFDNKQEIKHERIEEKIDIEQGDKNEYKFVKENKARRLNKVQMKSRDVDGYKKEYYSC